MRATTALTRVDTAPHMSLIKTDLAITNAAIQG